jgi:hypothetical protein
MNDRPSKDRSLIPVESIERSILLIRGQKVMLDADLAALYGVETKRLLQALKRNISRFPPDFVFQLNTEEFENLRSQFVTSSQWGGRRYPPYAFTEQGVAMLSSVLRSKRAVQVNIGIPSSNRNFTQRTLNSNPYRFPYRLSFLLLFFLTSSTFSIGALLSLSGVSPISPFFFSS